MDQLACLCKHLKKEIKTQPTKTRMPARWWSDKDILNGEITDAFVMIFRTRGCSWSRDSGCTMCGYYNDSMGTAVSEQDLLQQFNAAMKNYRQERIVKIFNSGSFFDDEEISQATRDTTLANRCSG